MSMRSPSSSRLKRLVRFLFASLTGGLILMCVTAFLMNYTGIFLSGGIEQWKVIMHSVAPYLRIWRLVVYLGLGGFIWHVYQRYQEKGDEAGVRRMRQIGGLSALLFIFVELSVWMR